ncbi:MAG TPA: hypothetical protein VF285_11285 [Castellaniella sp.]|uniref:hypothetical protein n=1 Tax=Castellaniella sp. TaxID=1955812 RepID=UPI002EF2557F
MILDTHICGIPCQVDVTHFISQRPMGSMADSDRDCYGYTEIDFEVLDSRGRPAPWLARKMTDVDTRAVEQEIIAAQEAEDRYCEEPV